MPSIRNIRYFRSTNATSTGIFTNCFTISLAIEHPSSASIYFLKITNNLKIVFLKYHPPPQKKKIHTTRTEISLLYLTQITFICVQIFYSEKKPHRCNTNAFTRGIIDISNIFDCYATNERFLHLLLKKWSRKNVPVRESITIENPAKIHTLRGKTTAFEENIKKLFTTPLRKICI